METNNTKNSDSIELNFEKEVTAAFEFLVTQYNFKVVLTRATYVRYECKDLFVDIYHGRLSNELGIEIGLLTKATGEEKGYTISELMRLSEEEKADQFMRPIANTPQKIKNGLIMLSSLLKQYGHEVLLGNLHIFDKLRLNRIQWNARFAHDLYVKQIKEKASIAFSQKKFSEAVRSYESILDDLLPIEQKKLEYARQKMKR